jgi:hypothetical protein
VTTYTRAELEGMGYTVDLATGRAVRMSQDAPPPADTPALPGIPPILPVLERPTQQWREKDEQRECWRLLLACGYTCYWLSQPIRSYQSLGIPDIIAHRAAAPILYVECKRWPDPAPWTSAQQAFARSAAATGHADYVLGTEHNLRVYLRARGHDV